MIVLEMYFGKIRCIYVYLCISHIYVNRMTNKSDRKAFLMKCYS